MYTSFWDMISFMNPKQSVAITSLEKRAEKLCPPNFIVMMIS